MQLPLEHPSWFEWILGILWEIWGYNLHQESLWIPLCPTCVLFHPEFSEFVLIFQLDNFPIDLLWWERTCQRFLIGTRKNRDHSPRKSSPAVTLLRAGKEEIGFLLFFLWAFCFSVLPSFGWYWWHITAQWSCAPGRCTRAAAGARPAYCHLKERVAGVRRGGVRECLFIVLSLTGPQM